MTRAAALLAAILASVLAPLTAAAQGGWTPNVAQINGWEHVCLSGSSQTDSLSVQTLLSGTITKLMTLWDGSATIRQRSAIVRGARVDLPAAISQVENENIRSCMVNLYKQNYPALPAQASLVQFKFLYINAHSPRAALSSQVLKVYVRTPTQVLDTQRLVDQAVTPDGPLYRADTPLPKPGETVTGSIQPEPGPDAKLSSETATTRFCLLLGLTVAPPNPPQDLFVCSKGGACQPSVNAGSGLLRTCAPQHAANPDWLNQAEGRLWSAAYSTDSQTPARWIGRTLEDLTRTVDESKGFSAISVRTDAFRRPDVIGVEVEVLVNGVALEEDGLSAADRPIPNDAGLPFSYSFAIESQIAHGTNAGCDTVVLRMTPVARGGGRGTTVAATLPFIPLRDSAPQSAGLGDSSLTWSTLYFRPGAAWRNEAFLNSFVYSPNQGQASEAAARAAAKSAKDWIDSRRLTFSGARVIGVIRPPLAINGNGKAAYGVAVGLSQPGGEVRFTFPVQTAWTLQDLVRATRSQPGGSVALSGEKAHYVYGIRGRGAGAKRIQGICTEVTGASPSST